jgi:hypothetical protein
MVIWPAYWFTRLLITGTGYRINSPSEKSPWAAREAFGPPSAIRESVSSNASRSTAAVGMWRKILASSDLEEPFVPTDEIDDVARIMVEFKIDPKKFAGNLIAVLNQGSGFSFEQLSRYEQDCLPKTPSISEFENPLRRPFLPLWLLAGFPDVVAWSQQKLLPLLKNPDVEEEEIQRTMAELYGIDLGSLEKESVELVDDDGDVTVAGHRALVTNYLNETGKSLEVSLDPNSADDIYLGYELLSELGEESNLTLTATWTMRCYMQLMRAYGERFPDETSLLAMAGIMDANVYVFITGELEPEQVMKLAEETKGEENRLYEFMVRFAALLMSVHEPGMEVEYIEDLLRDDSEAVRRTLERESNASTTYPHLAALASNLMQELDFRDIRRAAGVRNP